MLIKDLDDNLNPITPRPLGIADKQRQIIELQSQCLKLCIESKTSEAIDLIENKIATITDFDDIAHLLSFLQSIRNKQSSSLRAA